MKKFLICVTAVLVGYIGWIEASKRMQDRAVWQEVTDPIA